MRTRDIGDLEKLFTFPPETEKEVKNYATQSANCQSKLPHGFPIPDLAVIQSGDSIQEDKQPDEGCGEEHARVPAKPGKVQPDLLSKIPPVWDTKTLKPQWCVKFRVITLGSGMSLSSDFPGKTDKGNEGKKQLSGRPKALRWPYSHITLYQGSRMTPPLKGSCYIPAYSWEYRMDWEESKWGREPGKALLSLPPRRQQARAD